MLPASLFFTIPAVTAQSLNNNGYTVPVITPRPVWVSGLQQPLLSLNGDWDFKVKGSAKRSSIKVPGEWGMQGYTVNEGETAVYSCQLKIPADWMHQTVKLRFDAVSSHAVIKLNGKKLAEHEGGFVPFEVDLSTALQQQENLLEVEVQAQTISDKLACTSQYAVHTVGGILRKVTLFALPKTYLSDMYLHTEFDRQYKNSRLIIHTSIENSTENTILLFTLRDAEGNIVVQKRSRTYEPRSIIKVVNPVQWNPEHPYQYELTCELLKDGQVLETVRQKMGFKQVEIKDSRVYVNGQPVKLHGVNRHSVHPLTGRSISTDFDVLDAQLFREANCNYIRTSHYPPSEEFLNACDSLGLFVESESALCWIQHGASPIWKKWNYRDEKFLPFMVAANVENVFAGRNHPSIIMWSLGNESYWSPLWEQVHALIKQLDPTRPTVFHDQCWGGFNNGSSKADIANYHYPGINGPQATDTMSRPVLFGEYAHLSTYNRRELITDPGIRSAYGEPLVRFYDSIYHHDKCLGGAIWSGIDDIFHLPDGRIVGYGPWGPLDGRRRKKPEYWGIKKAYTPVRITGVDLSNAVKGFAVLHAENRFDFTSLKDVKIKVIYNNGNTAMITSDIAAHGKGDIQVPLPLNTTSFYISFTDKRGVVVNEEEYIVNKATAELRTNRPAFIQMKEDEMLITVEQNGITYLISKNHGSIIQIKRGEDVLLAQGPSFTVVPMNSDDGGKPNVAGETYQNNIYPLKNYALYNIFSTAVSSAKTDSGIVIHTQISYADGSSARMEYRFTGNELQIYYTVMYKGKDTKPYQYGMLMQLPETFDRLTWKRNGAFTTYPANDIARNNGNALLNSRQTNGVEPWRIVPPNDWKDDADERGSNDFRSTKHNILEVSLQDNKANRIVVRSDSKQSSRSWLQDGTIQWLIADYSNNGSESFYGSPFSDGRIDIKDKMLTGRLFISFPSK